MPTSAPNPPTSRGWLRLARLATSCLVVVTLWACGPVYIPVPPPDQATFTSMLVTDSSGAQRAVWIASGGPNAASANALFYVFDSERDAGVIATADPSGAYVAPPMDGTMGDHILIYYQDMHGRISPTACLILSEQRPLAARCP